jgi:UDP-3-O-[3-hydroxymyristoyl] glucosamine N-acyltransferase
VGKGVRVAAQGGVIGDIDPGKTVSGFPARDHREFLRASSALFKLPEALKRIKEMEGRISALEGSEPG